MGRIRRRKDVSGREHKSSTDSCKRSRQSLLPESAGEWKGKVGSEGPASSIAGLHERRKLFRDSKKARNRSRGRCWRESPGGAKGLTGEEKRSPLAAHPTKRRGPTLHRGQKGKGGGDAPNRKNAFGEGHDEEDLLRPPVRRDRGSSIHAVDRGKSGFVQDAALLADGKESAGNRVTT